MTATSSAPKTIASLLAEGQRILAEQARRGQEAKDRIDAEVRENWNSLRAKAQEDLGELAESLPVSPPDDFGPAREKFAFTLRPWGAAAIVVHYLKYEGEWIRFRNFNGHGKNAISVPTEFVATYDADADEPYWYPRPTEWLDTDNLAEAVAVCHRVSVGEYARCVQECADKTAAGLPKLAVEKWVDSSLSRPERALILALREMIADRVEE